MNLVQKVVAPKRKRLRKISSMITYKALHIQSNLQCQESIVLLVEQKVEYIQPKLIRHP